MVAHDARSRLNSPLPPMPKDCGNVEARGSDAEQLSVSSSPLTHKDFFLPPTNGNEAVLWARRLGDHRLVEHKTNTVCIVCGACESTRQGKISNTKCIGFALAADEKTQRLQKRYVTQLQRARANKDTIAKKLVEASRVARVKPLDVQSNKIETALKTAAERNASGRVHLDVSSRSAPFEGKAESVDADGPNHATNISSEVEKTAVVTAISTEVQDDNMGAAGTSPLRQAGRIAGPGTAVSGQTESQHGAAQNRVVTPPEDGDVLSILDCVRSLLLCRL